MDEAENLSSTQGMTAAGEDSLESCSLPNPTKIGRYTILRRLGKGGFGEVFLAFDDDLNRFVAIKVPRPERVSQPEDIEAYLNEARIVASLDHPHIVPVYDVGRTEDGLCFVVSKLIEGCDLAKKIKESRRSFQESAELAAAIAEALHFAHTSGLVHRDIKPGNILMDDAGHAFLADFGLALREEDYGTGARIAGTPSYMSPEQARGEGHRVDGRSDIFSLGVVIYELLTGRRPFVAKATDKDEARNELLDLIATTEARPPRQIDDSIPKELERICLKAMSKRVSDRYNTGRDIAEDLRDFLKSAGGTVSLVAPTVTTTSPPGSTQEVTPVPSTSKQSDSDHQPVRIVPKGLRSFDEHDADFFLELLPGPRDRDGLPDSIRFWKRKVEQIDPDLTFKVGLIYGPSGCGKSSLLKAGLLPRLGKHVLPVYIEATPEETETRLLKGLRKVCPQLAQGSGLVDSLANLRRGRILRPERKVLLVLDQFEQWLFARRGEVNTELVAALRHCDGEHVQAVVLVRDDFWMAATRFMRDLEIRLVEGENSAAVDLFDLDHARKVLAAFGRAFGKLPENPPGISSDQKRFLQESVDGLAEEGKVISVRLALYAEMMKGKSWAPSTLKEVGGTKGVGVTFLEETFSTSTAPPEHRRHQNAAQTVLKALLPESGTDIKGQMRSRQDLLNGSGYANRPREFDDLTHILDTELRLITPTDPEGSASENQTTLPNSQYYQLTHDYLVHSLRDWLTRKQRETRRGRAELRLAERSSLWNNKPENRHLPSVGEWANIRLLTSSEDWTKPQTRMMKRAGRVHGIRSVVSLLLVVCAILGSLVIRRRVEEDRNATYAKGLVEQVLKANISQVPGIVASIRDYRTWVDPALKAALANSSEGTSEKLHASLALLPVDASQAEYLYVRLLNSDPIELPIIWKAMRENHQAPIDRLWKVLNDGKTEKDQRFRAACALANVEAEADSQQWDAVASPVADRLLGSVLKNPSHYPSLIETLRPVRDRLLAPLSRTFRDQGKLESERSLATSILSDYAADRPDVLTDLLMDAAPPQFAILFPKAQAVAVQALPVLESELVREPKPEATEYDKDELARRQARAAVTLMQLGRSEKVWTLLRHSGDPRLRNFIVNWLAPLGADPRTLVAELGRLPMASKPTPARGQQIMDAVLFHPETSQRRALILALGTYGTDGLSPGEREPLIRKLLDLYRNDTDAGIHGAAEWALRQWKNVEKLKGIDAELSKLKDRGDRRWFVNSQGQTFAVIEGPLEFLMGSPPTEPDHSVDETAHRVVIPRRFAIAAKEVSKEQWQVFVKQNPEWALDAAAVNRYSPDPDGPMIGFSWYIAAAFCNWLSEQEGLPKEQWCYLPTENGKYITGMTIPADVLRRKGYRLPTEAEWEYACRSGTMTSRYYGLSLDLLNGYAWYRVNDKDYARTCGSLRPNDLGLFDMLGNVGEWVQDENQPYKERRYVLDDINTISLITEHPRVLRGGTFNYPSASVRSAFRSRSAPMDRYDIYGFRPSRTYP